MTKSQSENSGFFCLGFLWNQMSGLLIARRTVPARDPIGKRKQYARHHEDQMNDDEPEDRLLEFRGDGL